MVARQGRVARFAWAAHQSPNVFDAQNVAALHTCPARANVQRGKRVHGQSAYPRAVLPRGRAGCIGAPARPSPAAMSSRPIRRRRGRGPTTSRARRSCSAARLSSPRRPSASTNRGSPTCRLSRFRQSLTPLTVPSLATWRVGFPLSPAAISLSQVLDNMVSVIRGVKNNRRRQAWMHAEG
jgi:hypothetical protein